MNRFRKSIIQLMIVITASMVSVGNLYAVSDPDQKRKIKQDIDILEGILDQLIIQDSPYLFSSGDHVNGIYLDGFGIMFDFESSGLLSLTDMIGRTISALPRIRFSNEDDELIIEVEKDDKKEKGEINVKAEIEKSLRETEELIYEFFINYATTVKSLENDEQICINIRNSRGFLVDEVDEDLVPSQLRACAGVADLVNYRRGKTNEAKLRSQIDIERVYGEESFRDLAILEKILDQALDRNTGSKLIDWDGNSRSMYLDGYGAIFFSPVSALDRFEHIVVRKAQDFDKKMAQIDATIQGREERVRKQEAKVREYEAQVREHEEKLRDREKEYRRSRNAEDSDDARVAHPALPAPPEPIDDTDLSFSFNFDFDEQLKLTEKQSDSVLTSISDKLIEVLGQYGSTLKSVQKNEFVLIAVDIDDGFINTGADALYLKVSKADIDRYAREEISFDKFKSSVVVWRD